MATGAVVLSTTIDPVQASTIEGSERFKWNWLSRFRSIWPYCNPYHWNSQRFEDELHRELIACIEDPQHDGVLSLDEVIDIKERCYLNGRR